MCFTNIGWALSIAIDNRGKWVDTFLSSMNLYTDPDTHTAQSMYLSTYPNLSEHAHIGQAYEVEIQT